MTPEMLNEIEALVKAAHPARNYGPIAEYCLKLVARVRELETDAIGAQLNIEGLMGQRDREEARVAVLRETIQPYAEATGSYCWGEDDCAFLKEALTTLDPAATALTERLKAAEAVCDLVAKIPEKPSPSHRIMTPGFDELKTAWEAWRKLKGEPSNG